MASGNFVGFMNLYVNVRGLRTCPWAVNCGHVTNLSHTNLNYIKEIVEFSFLWYSRSAGGVTYEISVVYLVFRWGYCDEVKFHCSSCSNKLFGWFLNNI